MDYLAEILAQIFIEGAVEGSRNSKIPREIRLVFAITIMLLYLGLTILFAYICISASVIYVKVVFGFTALLFTCFLVDFLRKLKRRK